MAPIIIANAVGLLILFVSTLWLAGDLKKTDRVRKKFFLIGSVFVLFFFCSTEFVATHKRKGKLKAAATHKAAPVYNIPNFHIITTNIIRGAQPPEEGFKILKDYSDVKTILSLRHEEQHNEWEREIVEGLGMNFINIPMRGGKKQSIEKIQMCLNIINDESKQPVFVHCRSGKDRTGLIFAGYRIKYDNWRFEDAYKEMLAYGFNEAYYNLKKSLIDWYNYASQNKKEDTSQAPIDN